jgi:aryl-alcohol dehydrogenase-like predicted oxidoreductase
LNQRPLGQTGQLISEIGFGCGNQAGLLVRGTPQEQLQAVSRAVELGITYFDTAASYGDGVSEQNLGRALRELKPKVLVGTKLGIGQPGADAGPAHIERLLDESLARLGRDSVDLLYLHGRIVADGRGDARGVEASAVLGTVLPTFQRFREQGRVRFLGITGLGDTEAVLRVMQPGAFDMFHCYFSAINPSAGFPMPAGKVQQHLGGLIDRAIEVGMGVLAIRVLAAGALAGQVAKHPLASTSGGSLIAGLDYETDAAQAERLRPLADELGITLPELGIRFALSKPEVSAALVGVSDADQIEVAARAADAGPLPDATVQRILELAREYLGH